MATNIRSPGPFRWKAAKSASRRAAHSTGPGSTASLNISSSTIAAVRAERWPSVWKTAGSAMFLKRKPWRKPGPDLAPDELLDANVGAHARAEHVQPVGAALEPRTGRV